MLEPLEPQRGTKNGVPSAVEIEKEETCLPGSAEVIERSSPPSFSLVLRKGPIREN